ncbi:MAG: hypothetical protein GX869_07580 [Candidatus Cloacimonetes bacterium]|nr:hypothetical protein [Candidatus Cloacimonadota bacterium]
MLIKSNIKIPKRASKFVAVLNNVTFIFYGLQGESGGESGHYHGDIICYVRSDENYTIERTLNLSIRYFFSVLSDENYLYVFGQFWDGTDTMPTRYLECDRVAFDNTELLKTSTYMMVNPENEPFNQNFCFAEAQFFLRRQIMPSGANSYAITYDFTNNTYLELAAPINPSAYTYNACPYQICKYHDYLYLYFAGFGEEDNKDYGAYYFLIYDIIANELRWEEFEMDFNPELPEGQRIRYYSNGLVAKNDVLFMLISIEVSRLNAEGVLELAGVKTFVLLKSLLTGLFSKYQQNEQGTLMELNPYRVGITQRNCYVFLKGLAVSPVHNFYRVGYIANPLGVFNRNFYTIVQCRYFSIPETPLPCKVPLAYVVQNGENLDLYETDLNILGVPPKPYFLSSGIIWNLYGDKLYAAYSGFEAPSKAEIEIRKKSDNSLVVQRTIDGSDTFITLLVTDGLAWNTEYKYRIRYYDVCDYTGLWSEWAEFICREKPLVKNINSTTSGFPVVSFEVDDYGIDIIELEIIWKQGETIVYSNTYPAPLYKTTSGYSVLVDSDGILNTGVEYSLTVKAKNIINRTGESSILKTLSFVRPDEVNLSISQVGAYFKLTWISSVGKYRVYKDGIRLCETTANEYLDLGVKFNTNVVYKVCSVNDDAQAVGIPQTKNLTSDNYGLVCEDGFSEFVILKSQLGLNISYNPKSVADKTVITYKTKGGAITILTDDIEKYELRIGKNWYIKQGKEVHHVLFTEYSIDRELKKESGYYGLTISCSAVL